MVGSTYVVSRPRSAEWLKEARQQWREQQLTPAAAVEAKGNKKRLNIKHYV